MPSWMPKVRNLEELNRLLETALGEEQKRGIDGRSQTIGAAMLAEREPLLPLAGEGLGLAELPFPQVNPSGCVRGLTNFYSTPLPVGIPVEAKVYSACVEVWQEGHCVARHERCYERHQQVLELDHYLDVLGKKPGALAGSTALEPCRAQGRWPASYDRWWSLARERDGRAAGTKVMIEVLRRSRTYAAARVRQAVEEAWQRGAANRSAVRYLLHVDGKPASADAGMDAATVEIGTLRR